METATMRDVFRRTRGGRTEENVHTSTVVTINDNIYKRESKLSSPEESDSPSTNDPPLGDCVCVTLGGLTPPSSLSEEAYLDVTTLVAMRIDAAFRRAR